MKQYVVFFLLLIAGSSLTACALPGQAFPGGPSPWLPGGAPGSVYAPPQATPPTPATVPRAEAAGTAAKALSVSSSASIAREGGFRYNAGCVARQSYCRSQ